MKLSTVSLGMLCSAGVAKSQALERPTKRSRKGLRQLPSQQQAASASSLQKRIPIKRATGSELQALSS